MKKLLSFLVLFSAIGPLSAQQSKEEIDSLVDKGWDYMNEGIKKDSALMIVQKLEAICKSQMNEKACLNIPQLKGEYHYFSGTMDSAVYYYTEGMEAARMAGNKNEEAYCAGSLGGVFATMGKNDLALMHFQNALDYRIQVGDTANTLHIFMKRAWLRVDAEQIDAAMQDCIKALKYAEDAKDYFNVGRIYSCMSVLFEKQNQFEKAIEYHERSSAQFALIDYEAGINSNKVNMAIILKNLGRYEESFALYEQALASFRKSNYEYGKMSVFANLTVLANRSGDYKRALMEADSALAILEDFQNIVTESDLYNEKGIAYLAMGESEKALQFSQRAIAILDDSDNSLEKRKDAEKTLSEIYSELGDYRSALDHFRTFAMLNDSIFETRRSNQMLKLEEQYESQKKQGEIESLNAANELAETKQRAMQFGLIGVILLSGVILNREYQRKKKSRALHVSELKLAESEKIRLQNQLEFKNKELTAQALHIAQKNEMLNAIKAELEEAKRSGQGDFAQGVLHKINLDSQIDRNWDQFIKMFTETNADFLQTISSRFPDVSKNELRLCALIKMNLTNKDIGTVLNISDDGVKKARYRLRKKMKLETNDSLEQVILNV